MSTHKEGKDRMDVITKTKVRNTFKGSRSSMLVAGVVVLAVALAGFTVLRLQAAGFFAAADATQSSVSGNAQLVSDPTAYGGKAIQFKEPAAPPPPSGGGSCVLPSYPNASCTGVPSGTSLTTISGDYTAKAGEVVSGKRITGKLSIGGNNVTIRNSEILGEVKNNGSSNNTFTIEDSTVGPTSGCNGNAAIGHNNYTMTRVRIRGFGEGPRFEHGNNVLVQDSFIKLCDPGGDAHADGMQGYFGGTNVVVRHNTIDTTSVPLARITANIFWSDSSANGLQFKDNMLAGGGYTIRIHSGSGHTVSGNQVVDGSWYYGPVSSNCGGISWTNNSIVKVDSSYKVTSTVGSLACKN